MRHTLITSVNALIEAQISQLKGEIMSEITDLQAAVTAITTAVNNAITEIQTLAAQVQNNSTDPAAMEAAAASLNTLATNLAAAMPATTSAPVSPAGTEGTASTGSPAA
jgi:argininosuccinate lyase